MIIQKMNNALVKHGKVTFTFFTIIIIISFVWYFAPGRDGSMFFGGMRGANSKYGEVIGQDITINDVRDAAQDMRLFYSAYQPGVWGRNGFDDKQMFRYAVLLKVADAVGVQASDDEVRDMIRSMPSFQKDGKFSEELYIKYKDDYLEPEGNGFSALEDAVRTSIRIEKLMDLGGETTVVADGEADTFAELMLQKISYHTITFDPESFADKAGDVDANKYYEDHKQAYKSLPEFDGILVYAPYVTVETVEPTEKEIREHYEALKQNYTDSDGTERPFDEVKDDIRRELSTKNNRDETAAQDKIENFYKSLLAAITADPETYVESPDLVGNRTKLFLDEAKKAGLGIDDAISGITRESLAETGRYLEQIMINDFTDGKHGVGDFTRPIPGSDCGAVFLITASRAAETLPFEQVKDKVTADAVEQKKNELANAAAVEFAAAFEKLEDKGAGIVALVESSNGIWGDETTVTRFQLEKDLEERLGYISLVMQLSPNVDWNAMQAAANNSIKAIKFTEIGKLSSPYYSENSLLNGKMTTEFVFVTAHAPATPEEIEEQGKTVGSYLKSSKRRFAVSGFNYWWGSTVLEPFSGNRN